MNGSGLEFKLQNLLVSGPKSLNAIARFLKISLSKTKTLLAQLEETDVYDSRL